MNISIGDLLTIEGEKYITLEVLSHEDSNYAFVNKMTDEEEATEEFYIFEDLGDSVKIIVDDDLKNSLLPKFEELLKKDIEKLINE